MSSTLNAAGLLLLFSSAYAFPSISLGVRQDTLLFDAASQYVSNQGEHAYIAPGPTDVRSPCPALNVMANHGYIPRNGYVTLLQMDKGLFDVFGISADLASVLDLILRGTTMKGDSFSIGGFSSERVGETPYQFIQTYDIGSINSLNPMQQICKNYAAIDGNKYQNDDFFSQGGAINDELFFRAFGNKSAEYPLGSLDASDKLAMLAMIPNGDGTFTWDKFHNSIPDNWYKSNIAAPFSAATFVSDVVSILAYGCAPGHTAMYRGVDISALTNGVYTNDDLEDPKTNACFMIQAAPIFLPAVAKQSIFSDAVRQNVAAAVNEITKGTNSVDCSSHTLKSLNLAILGQILGISIL